LTFDVSLAAAQVVGKASPRGPAGKASGSGVSLSPAASSEDTATGFVAVPPPRSRGVKAEHGGAGAPDGAAAELSGLAGLAALAGAVTTTTPDESAQVAQLRALLQQAQQVAATPAQATSMQVASFYALQTELLLFKVR